MVPPDRSNVTETGRKLRSGRADEPSATCPRPPGTIKLTRDGSHWVARRRLRDLDGVTTSHVERLRSFAHGGGAACLAGGAARPQWGASRQRLPVTALPVLQSLYVRFRSSTSHVSGKSWLRHRHATPTPLPWTPANRGRFLCDCLGPVARMRANRPQEPRTSLRRRDGDRWRQGPSDFSRSGP